MAEQHPAEIGACGSASAESESPEADFSTFQEMFRIGNIGGPSTSTNWLSSLSDKISSRKSKSEVARKRGPKPDQRPAKNEKVERNRKAQRSHRERKERYIRNLEQEVQRLREAYTISVKEKTAVMDENRQLHVLLKENGIIFPHPVQAQALLSIENEGVTGNLAQLQLHSHNEHYEHPQSSISPPQIGLNHSPGQQLSSEQYSRIAIDLVLAMEKRCSNHLQKFASLSTHNPDYIQGHVLMMSCPPESYTLSHPNQDWGSKTVDLEPGSLGTLFNMQVLDARRKRYLEGLDGELTPIATWTKITIHPRFNELTLKDFAILQQTLPAKVGCHGFGAVVEEWEVEDVLEELFATKYSQA